LNANPADGKFTLRARIGIGHRSIVRMEIRVSLIVLVALLILPGCVSKRYQSASKKTPPAVPLTLTAQQPPLTAAVNTLIVFEGPGSWKREAYWDEYVVSIVNQGQSPITVANAVLHSSVIGVQTPGSDPWALEKESHKILKDQTLGRQLVAGAGTELAVLGFSAGALALGSLAVATGSAAAVAGATVAVIALPVFVIGSGVRAFTAPHAIHKEFDRRRLALPLVLQPGEMRQGSLFFPITPGPQQLELECQGDGKTQSLDIDLAPLANLHFSQPPPAATPPAPAPSPTPASTVGAVPSAPAAETPR
jgi:hypothetical protein